MDVAYAELAIVYREEGLGAEVDVLSTGRLEPAAGGPWLVPTVVPLGVEEPLQVCVLAGTVMQVRRGWFVAPAGALSAQAMRAVDHALKEVLSLP